jgi:hypothetical protein
MIKNQPAMYSLPNGSGVPSLASDEVALVAGPLDAVLSLGTVLVVHIAGAVGPEGVVEASIGASAARGAGTREKGRLGAIGRAHRGGDSAEGGRAGNKEGSERDHVWIGGQRKMDEWKWVVGSPQVSC